MSEPSGVPKPWTDFRVGTYGGRQWHIRAGVKAGRTGVYRPVTWCDREGDDSWRPGVRNIEPKICAKCLESYGNAIEYES